MPGRTAMSHRAPPEWRRRARPAGTRAPLRERSEWVETLKPRPPENLLGNAQGRTLSSQEPELGRLGGTQARRDERAQRGTRKLDVARIARFRNFGNAGADRQPKGLR